uniref:Uncharacterized protein n=1 Tax=Rhizophora mucronata TaxID=61149 RepID=A0A2P2KJB0_RHIMU
MLPLYRLPWLLHWKILVRNQQTKLEIILTIQLHCSTLSEHLLLASFCSGISLIVIHQPNSMVIHLGLRISLQCLEHHLAPSSHCSLVIFWNPFARS